jgi:O-antigen ligase
MKLLAPERLQRIERFLWALTLVTVPVTSFRFFPFPMSNAQVRPLSFFPAILLFFVIIVRCFQQRRLLFWNRNFLPLVAFGLVALISSAVGFLLIPPNLYNNTYASRLLRAWATFGVGFVFLIVPMSMNRDEQDLKFTLKWLYMGFVGQLVWSLVQLFSFYLPTIVIFKQPLINLIDLIQKTMMMAGISPNKRISGLTLEPSWLAAQVVTIYLPWAFASLLKGYFWGKRRWPTVAILMASGVLIIFTYSRSGILTAVAALFFTFLFAGWGWMKWAWKWFQRPFHGDRSVLSRRILNVSSRIILIIAILVGLTGGSYVLTRNQYFARIWQSDKHDLTSYFVDIYAGPRLAFAWAGWTIFEQHPWTGVGFGATGLYFIHALPDWSQFNIPEISRLLYPDNHIYPNAKNLYIRLLAETGIMGFWLFITFYLLLLGRALFLLRSRRKELAFVGAASLVAWVAIVILGFSQDSLAMLNIWMPLGILVGMADSSA